MPAFNTNLTGLTTQEVLTSRSDHGTNKTEPRHRNAFISAVKDAVQEPMLVLLAVASTLYFIHGDTAEGLFLLVAIALVYSISNYQKSRSENALEALKKLTQPRCKVIRNGQATEIAREEVVVGDLLIVEEGALIAADAIIVQSNDFTVNESVLTGESLPVDKGVDQNPNVYQGTLVVSGLALCKVTAVGNSTQVGQIGRRLEEVKAGASPLQEQITSFVKKMALVGIVVFVVIWAINIYQTHSVIDSLLNSLTLAMSILPEEIPVAFATFMALGAWRLIQLGVIVKDTRTVETLGSATIICVDKTGTITKNEMTLDKVYVHASKAIFSKSDSRDIEDVITTAMWASEPIPFDPMEKALHTVYEGLYKHDLRPHYNLVKEYPLSGKPPIMTHVFQNMEGDETMIAAKGAPEAILRQCMLAEPERESVTKVLHELTSQGYRVLAVGQAAPRTIFPDQQSAFTFSFKGLVAFFDPPKDNIPEVLSGFYRAGINVKIITGDNVETTKTIAEQIGFNGLNRFITGEELMKLSGQELEQTVSSVNIFARMFPEAKLRVIQALQHQSEVVAMTGDGVNDGPALKAANIGIAMGQRGSEVAKQASAIILADDDLSRMVDAIGMGRKIYANLKKAIQYIISIHIPIILIVFIPLALGWVYPAVFTPIHVIFLELIMGPTCSIIYENEPMEQNAMTQPPRIFSKTFLNLHELSTSIIQGLVITGGLILVYQFAVTHGYDVATASALIFLALIVANVTLTLVNRSFYYSILTTLRYPNKLIAMIIGATTALVGLIFVVKPVRSFFSFAIPPAHGIVVAVATGFLSVLWFEGYKLIKRHTRSS
jgi:P-type Ca2+ transporter type 2C